MRSKSETASLAEPIRTYARDPGNHPLQDADTVLLADLAANIPHSETDIANQHFIAILGRPHDIKAVVINAIRRDRNIARFVFAEAGPTESRRF